MTEKKKEKKTDLDSIKCKPTITTDTARATITETDKHLLRLSNERWNRRSNKYHYYYYYNAKICNECHWIGHLVSL